MKIKTIIDYCKKDGYFRYGYSSDGVQLLGNELTFYVLPSVIPKLEKEIIASMYGLKEKVVHNSVFEECDIPNIYSADCYEEEEEILPMNVEIIYSGIVLMPFITKNGIKFINKKYLMPLETNTNELKYFLRGENYIAVKKGMLLSAVITEYSVCRDDIFVSEINKLCGLTNKQVDYLYCTDKKSL